MLEVGKTTIALHRIAYLIYNYEDKFNPEEFMIIAPNKFFLNYISNILPDLGVNDVKQCTFEDFAYEVIGKKIKIPDNNEKLVMIVNNNIEKCYEEKIDIILKAVKFKSSINFKNIIEAYIRKIELEYIPKIDFCYEDYKIMSYNDINELFLKTYKMYNFKARVHEIEKHLTSEFLKKSKEITEKLRSKRSKTVENLQGKQRACAFDEYTKKIEAVEKNYKKIIKQFMNMIIDKDCIEYYKDFWQNYFMQYINSTLINQEEPIYEVSNYLKASTLSNLERNEASFEDLAPLMYIKYKVSGIKEKCQIKHAVIDEAQDYGEFQFDVLKTILNSNSMTILGDIAQGIHFYRGIENWKRFIDVEFNNINVKYTTLQKTYRTTKEIMDIANEVISKLPKYEKEFIVLGEPVINRKNSVHYEKQKDIDNLIISINKKIEEYKKSGFQSIAIIGKDINECEIIQKKLSKIRDDVKLITGKDSEYNAGISIIPSYLAKGLEFDCVIISNANKEKYCKTSVDIKLLYVVITRAMSKLDIFYIGEISEILPS